MPNRRRYALIAWFLALPIALYGAERSVAQVPGTVGFQGVLTNAAGAPINGDVTVVFSLHSVATGGSPLWTGT